MSSLLNPPVGTFIIAEADPLYTLSWTVVTRGILVQLRLGLRSCADDLAKRKLVCDVLHGVPKLCEMFARLRGLLNIFSRFGSESFDLFNVGIYLHR